MYSNFEQENTDQNSSYKNFLIYVQGTLPKGELLSGMQAYTNSTAEINCWDKWKCEDQELAEGNHSK